MTRDVLAIPFEEIQQQFQTNDRHDVKVVPLKCLTEAECDEHRKRGRPIKYEVPLAGHRYAHSPGDTPNCVCASAEFSQEAGAPPVAGCFAVSFADEQADQGNKMHSHSRHSEIYISIHPIRAEYRSTDDNQLLPVALEQGGVLIFAQGVAHRVLLGGLATIIEAPAILDDKKVVEWALGERSTLEMQR